MAGGENEAVAVEPFRVGGIADEFFAEEDRADVGGAKGKAEVAGGAFVDGVHGEAAGFVGCLSEEGVVHEIERGIFGGCRERLRAAWRGEARHTRLEARVKGGADGRLSCGLPGRRMWDKFSPTMNSGALAWEEICEIPWLKDLPAKIETNGQNKILMSPASTWHGDFQGEVCHLLRTALPGGRVIVECPISTTDGIRVANVAWISRERWLPHRRSMSLPVSPEICVEILSRSNTREEMLGKMQLYYEKGAQEVWLCDEDGRMEFFSVSSIEPVPRSEMCPDFPQVVSVD